MSVLSQVSIALDGLVNGGIADSAVLSGTDGVGAGGISSNKMFEVNLLGGSGLETGYVAVSIKESINQNSFEDNFNSTDIGIIILNGVTPVRKILHYKLPVAPFFKISFKLYSSNLYPLAVSNNTVFMRS